MVLELLVRPHEAEREPWKMFLLSFLVGIFSYVLSHALFPDASSLVSVFVASGVLIPVFTGIFLKEEKDEEAGRSHMKEVFEVMWMFFLGMVFSYAFIYVLPLPKPEYQILEVSRITGRAIDTGLAGQILANNMKVLLLVYLLSFAFGAAAVFTLVWNASIVGTWLGEVFMKPAETLPEVLTGLISGLLSISPHAVMEFSAYFLASVAGALLSVGFLRRNLHHSLEESVKLFLVSALLIVLAAVVEAL